MSYVAGKPGAIAAAPASCASSLRDRDGSGTASARQRRWHDELPAQQRTVVTAQHIGAAAVLSAAVLS